MKWNLDMVRMVKTMLGAFWRKEDGNTTVDWVVLLAGILGMVFIVMASITGGVTVFGEKAEQELAERQIGFF